MPKRTYFYAYLVPGRGQGIAETWQECERRVSGQPDARFRKFRAREEAEAWLRGGADYADKPAAAPGIYFDAGTGRGRGVEISVTDEQGNNLLWKALPKKKLNRYGKHWIFGDVSNNYGELLACFLALTIARKDGVQNVFGDSRLVIDYWSKGRIKKNEVNAETVALAGKVKRTRSAFEKKGGAVGRVPGDANPADLGFHR
mgnify:CR=1 FL=1